MEVRARPSGGGSALILLLQVLAMALSQSTVLMRWFPRSSFAFVALLVCFAATELSSAYGGRNSSSPSFRKPRQWAELLWEWWPAIASHAAVVVVHRLAWSVAVSRCGVARSAMVAAVGGTTVTLFSSLFAAPSRRSSPSVVAYAAAVSALGVIVLVLFDPVPGGAFGLTAMFVATAVDVIGPPLLQKLPPSLRSAPLLLAALAISPFGIHGLASVGFSVRPYVPHSLARELTHSSANATTQSLFDLRLALTVAVSCSAWLFDNGLAPWFQPTRSRSVVPEKDHMVDSFAAFGSAVVLEVAFATLHRAGPRTFVAAALISCGTTVWLANSPVRKTIVESHSSFLELPISAAEPQQRTDAVGALQRSAVAVRNVLRHTMGHKKTRRLLAYLVLNLAFMAIEVAWGMASNSLGLISDGCHMLFDCLAVAIGLAAAVVGKWEPTQEFSFGFVRVEVLSGFVNGVMLVLIAVMIFVESLHRFFHPAELHTEHLTAISVAGLVVNLVGVLAFHQHGHGHGHGHDNSHSHDHDGADHTQPTTWRKMGKKALKSQKQRQKRQSGNDENLHGVFLHVLADTLGSVGVIVSSVLIEWRGLRIADPICSLVISALIFASVIPLLRSSSSILLQSLPFSANGMTGEIVKRIDSEAGCECTDISIWSLSPSRVVCNATVAVPSNGNEQRALSSVQSILREFGVSSSCVECVRSRSLS